MGILLEINRGQLAAITFVGKRTIHAKPAFNDEDCYVLGAVSLSGLYHCEI